MKRHLFKTFLFGFFILASPAHASTPVSGFMTTNTIWTEASSPYIVQGHLYVESGAVLTIEPGVVVKDPHITVRGTLNAYGTAEKKIYFTSSAADPYPGAWKEINISQEGEANFDHAVIQYGGSTSCCYNRTNILNQGTLNMANSIVEKSTAYGVLAQSGTTTITNSEIAGVQNGFNMTGGNAFLSDNFIHDNSWYGVYAAGPGQLSLSGNHFENNTYAGFLAVDGLQFRHGFNTFSGSGMGIFYMFGMISADTVWQEDFIPYLAASVTVENGAILTIEPGAVVKNPNFIVRGVLNANGTEDKPVYFTSEHDDSVGGDSDNNNTEPSPGNWKEIDIRSGGEANFYYSVIRYGGSTSCCYSRTNILNYGTLNLDHTIVASSTIYGILAMGDTNISNSEIAYQQYGLDSVSSSANITISNSSIHGNSYYGIYNNYPENILNARSNWWGDATGPRRSPDRHSGSGDYVTQGVDFEPWLGEDPLVAPTPTPTPTSSPVAECCSNVLFLPGLEASRLYRAGEDQVWEPTRNQDVKELYLLPSGESVNSDIYTRDVIDEAPRVINGFNVYKKFINFMDDEIVGGGIINEWEAIPYDWRLDFEKILASGKKIGETGGQNNISYLEATTTPYIFQELARLAENSNTKKVAIITHSNGGLLAKYLLSRLEDAGHPYHYLLEKIDKVIMVAAPQVGTPGAVEGLLHGDEQQFGAAVGVTDWGMMVDEERARELAENMQSAYNLLPSEKYFDLVQSPIMEFKPTTADVYDFLALYGATIDSIEELNNFLLGDPQTSTHRSEPAADDEESPNVVKSGLLSRSTDVHNIIDLWMPPAGMEVIQIAGWGIKTLRGIEYSCGYLTCSSLSTLDRDILKTHVGDGTVVLPSAVAMDIAENVEKFYVDIFHYNRDNFRTNRNRDHASILEIDPLREFIKNLVQDDETLTTHITTTIPVNPDLISLDYTIHSPVDIHIYDLANNQHTGLIPNPVLGSDMKAYEAQLPNSYYWEYGEVKYAGSEASETATTTVKLTGTDFGTFTFNINETLGDAIIATSTFKDIPVALGSILTMQIKTLASPISLQMDVDGNGVVDAVISPGEGLTTEELIGILIGFIKTLHLPEDRETQLIRKVDKLAKTLNADYYKKQRTDAAFASLVRAIDGYVKKGLLTITEATELKSLIGKIQGVVVE